MEAPLTTQIMLENLMQQRIIILDGAMGTMIQRQHLTEIDYRGTRFSDAPCPLVARHDVLTLTQPQVIAAIHRQYLQAGADIIETNTFNATPIALSEYGMAALAYELNFEGARLAKSVCHEFSTPEWPRFVAGSIGPTAKKSIEIESEQGGIAFIKGYEIAIQGLIDGGVDLLIVETIFDVNNAAAVLVAIAQVMKQRKHRVPVIISATLTDDSGYLLSGHSLADFYTQLQVIKPLAMGFNCSLGLDNSQALTYIKAFAEISAYPLSVALNAGFPNAAGAYELSPEMMVEQTQEWANAGLVNIVGGCCGTTPSHIRKLAEQAKQWRPRTVLV